MGGRVFILAALLLALLVAPATAHADYKSVTRDVYVPMSDGVRIAVSLGLPSNDGVTPAPGKFPVILTMTPYSRQVGPPTSELIAKGYVHAVADIRGAGGSEGNLNGNYFSPREQQDGYELVEWAGTQPFSTGKVGMAGGSYLGITQYLTAELQPPHLAAIAPAVALSDLYREATYHGGILSQFFGAQYLLVQGAPGVAGGNSDPSQFGDLVKAKVEQAQSAPIAFDYLGNTTDVPFYRDRSPIYRADKIQVPVFIYDGWFDGFIRGASEMFPVLARRPGVETDMLVNPVTHKNGSPEFEPNPYPAKDPEALLPAMLAFFDRALKGIAAPARPPVKLYLMGADRYLESNSWPPEGTRAERLYLRPGGMSADPAPAGEQAYAANPAEGTTVTFDRHGTVAASPYFPQDQSLESNLGVVWRTDPLRAPLTVVGPIAFHLLAATTASDTDWFVRISDEAPDGHTLLLTEGFLRASHRELDPSKSTTLRPYHVHTNPTPVEPGATIPYEIEVWPTANQFQPGHRLRVQLTSRDTPNHLPGSVRIDRANPAASEFTPLLPSVNTVKYGGVEGTSIELPVYQGQDGGGVASSGGSGPGCADRKAPVVSVTRKRATRRRLTLRGTARDRGCGKVARVEVRVGRGPWKAAKGRTAWRLTKRGRFGRTTRVQVRAIDRAGNVSKARHARVRR